MTLLVTEIQQGLAERECRQLKAKKRAAFKRPKTPTGFVFMGPAAHTPLLLATAMIEDSRQTQIVRKPVFMRLSGLFCMKIRLAIP